MSERVTKCPLCSGVFGDQTGHQCVGSKAKIVVVHPNGPKQPGEDAEAHRALAGRHLAALQDLDRLRGENERLRRFVEETTAIDCGCVTGDCPHSTQTECFDAIVAALKEVGDGARAALEPQ